MEAISQFFVALGEFIALFRGLARPFISFAILIGLIAFVDYFLTWNARRLDKNQETEPFVPPKLMRYFHIGVKWSLGVCGLLVVGLMLLQFVFFDSAMHWIAQQAQSKSGIKIEFEEATGNLFSGELNIQELQLAAHNSKTQEYDLHVGQLSLNVDYWDSLWGEEISVEFVELQTLKGKFTKLAKSKPREPRKPFKLRSLKMSGIDIEISDQSRGGDPFESRLEVDSFESQNFRSRHVVYQVLFKSEIKGRLAGRPFHIQTSEDKNRTEWNFSEMPVSEFSYYLNGPFDYLESGNLSVQMVSEAKVPEEKLLLGWDIQLHDIHAHIPEGRGPIVSKVALPMVGAINKAKGNLDLELQTELSREGLEGQASYDTALLADAFKTGFKKGVYDKYIGATIDKMNPHDKGILDSMLQKTENALKKRFKNKKKNVAKSEPNKPE